MAKKAKPLPWAFLDEFRGKNFNGQWPTLPEMFSITVSRYPNNSCFTDFEPEKVDVYFESKGGNIIVCKNGASVEFDEDIAKKILIEDEITIKIDMGLGDVTVTAWGCDLTYEYVKINGDYRS